MKALLMDLASLRNVLPKDTQVLVSKGCCHSRAVPAVFTTTYTICSISNLLRSQRREDLVKNFLTREQFTKRKAGNLGQNTENEDSRYLVTGQPTATNHYAPV